MTNKQYVDRIVQATGISEAQASQALFAIFQGFLDSVGDRSNTSINFTSGPDCDNQPITNISVVVNIVVHPPTPPR